MSCPVAWSDPDGEHSCRHTAGHELRRHTCQCGSAANARESTITTPHAEQVSA